MNKQDQDWKNALRFVSAGIMMAGLGFGFYEYVRITNLAESSVHEVYAVAQSVMWAIFGYITARAFDHIAEAALDLLRAGRESSPSKRK